MSRIFSGIQPSGELHIGNYLGAVKNWVELQHQEECLICVVDLHAITGKYEPAALTARTREMALGILAAGIDPAQATLFIQSQVPEHAELQWLLTTLTPVGELERMTQYKDKAQRFESIPAGILVYPVLMAADILLYRADAVPVGDDQVQHLELAREIARKWNAEFSPDAPFFPEPKPILSTARRIMGLDGQAKMSKSLGNTVALLDEPEAIWQKLRPAMTDPARKTKKDPGNPDICNVFTLHKHFSPPVTVAEVDQKCRSAGWGCLDCKKVLADNMGAALAPIRARAATLAADPAAIDTALAQGAERAGKIAKGTMTAVRQKMGFLPARKG
jgi:tryptophanyl-tRNA synthetase